MTENNERKRSHLVVMPQMVATVPVTGNVFLRGSVFPPWFRLLLILVIFDGLDKFCIIQKSKIADPIWLLFRNRDIIPTSSDCFSTQWDVKANSLGFSYIHYQSWLYCPLLLSKINCHSFNTLGLWMCEGRGGAKT